MMTFFREAILPLNEKLGRDLGIRKIHVKHERTRTKVIILKSEYFDGYTVHFYDRAEAERWFTEAPF